VPGSKTNACSACAAATVVQHRYDLARPVAVARRIDGMHDHGAATCSLAYVDRRHRIALYPGNAVVRLRRNRPARQCAHLPAGRPQMACDFAADAAIRA